MHSRLPMHSNGCPSAFVNGKPRPIRKALHRKIAQALPHEGKHPNPKPNESPMLIRSGHAQRGGGIDAPCARSFGASLHTISSCLSGRWSWRRRADASRPDPPHRKINHPGIGDGRGRVGTTRDACRCGPERARGTGKAAAPPARTAGGCRTAAAPHAKVPAHGPSRRRAPGRARRADTLSTDPTEARTRRCTACHSTRPTRPAATGRRSP